jgi:hypothetical protein
MAMKIGDMGAAIYKHHKLQPERLRVDAVDPEADAHRCVEVGRIYVGDVSWLPRYPRYKRIPSNGDIAREGLKGVVMPKTDVEKIPLDDESTIKYILGDGEDENPDTFDQVEVPESDPEYKYKARLLGRYIPVLPEKHRKGFITVPPNCKSDDQITMEIYMSKAAKELYERLVDQHLYGMEPGQERREAA